MSVSRNAVFGGVELRAVKIKLNEAQLMYRTERMWPSTRVPPCRVSAGWLWVLHTLGGELEWHLYTVY